MKKSSLLMIPLMGIAAFLGVMVSNMDMTEAANNKTCSPEMFRDNYISKIDVNYDGNQVTITNNSGLNLSYTFYADSNTTNGISGDFASGVSATVTVENGGYFVFTLQENMENPCIASVGNEIGTMEVSVDGLIDNPLYYDSICVNYRNKWGNNQTMQNAVPYCFSAKTYESYSKEEVQGWINTAESLYESINSSSGNNDIVIDESYKKVDNVKKTDKLVCDAFSTNNYETMHKYYHIDDVPSKIENCEVTCKEEIEVNFSDPVATQAGMCFQYLIEIKSKVVCDSSYKAAPPKRKSVCYPSPVCISGGKGFDAGGPTEEFDACVLDCDGGEYTQSCIDSCYSEVYEKSDSNKKTAKMSKSDDITKDDVKAFSGLYIPSDSFYEARKLANSCPGTGNATDLYNYMQNNPSGHYSGKTWVSDYGSSSICSLGPYYFRSLSQTKHTIDMWKGNYKYSSDTHYYRPDGNGILMAIHNDNTWCSDNCSWKGTCGSNTVLTEAIAQKEYEEAVEKYLADKKACEQKATTCSNERTDYEIVVDNIDSDSDKDDDEETFSSSQKLNSTTVGGDFPSMVILTDGSCEDGKDDPWNYHNIITFPGTWINNKTGQTVHTMDKGHEDFYTYVGNSYCTKLNSVPINTAWYDWKVNQNGDASSLTEAEKTEIENNIEMNINGYIDNYGYFGWNFDVSCFYAIGEPDTSCTPDSPNYPNCDDPDDDGKTNEDTTAPVDDYTFRPVSLDNLFPNSVTPTSADDKNKEASLLINEVESLRNKNTVMQVDDDNREIGFNWTCGATNLENPDYPVQPVATMKKIQELGDSIYKGTDYLDYHIRLTPETMNKVREYNNKYDSYLEPTSDDSGEMLSAGKNKTSGITVYRSYLLHKVLNSNELLKSGVIGCNNEDKGTCSNVIDTSIACYNEYMAQSSVLKGAR